MSRNWRIAPVAPRLFEGARRDFPREPVRSLDALHLAMALELAPRSGGVAFLTLDRRLAENAALLGFDVLPRPR